MRTIQERRYVPLLGDGFIGTQTHLPPKFTFASELDHFILNMLENVIFKMWFNVI